MNVAKFFQYIASGTAYTLAVTFVSLPLGFIIGLIFSLLHIYGGKVLRSILTIYSTVMRGIPQIVLLFILYFIMSGNINLTPFWAGSISLGVVSSAYQMEIIRGAILSVSGSQMMVARAIGMSKLQAIINVVLPQAMRLVIPPWSITKQPL
ncbi:MAG: ABC transporter permease subunit [Anaerolineaceae bacterium]|nr:ABC transporter permease subunit [Anaerolineaceae bacterium]